MRFGLGATVAKVATNIKTFGIKFLKDNLKIFFDFQNTDLEHVGRGSASFDGSNDVITITDNSVFSFGDGSTDQAFSITAWVKMIDATNFQIMNKGIFNTDGEWNFRTNSSDKLVFALYDESVSSTHESVISSALTTYQNQWIHVAATYDGRGGTSANDGMELYINGVNDSDSRSGAGTYVAMENLAGNVTIGAGNSAFAEGSIAQVGIWQRQLSSSEVLNIVYKEYSDLSGTELTHLFAWYPLLTDADSLVGVEGLTKYDGSNSGATFNSSVYGNNAPPKPRGVDNSSAALADQIGSGSASFDGSDDYINLGSPSTGTGIKTLSMWVKPNTVTSDDRIISNLDSPNFSIRFGSSDVELWGGSWVSLFTNPSASVWTHFAFVFDGSTNVIGYKDGIAGSSVSTSYDFSELGLGATFQLTHGNYFDGNIAQVGYWSRALTQEEIQEISQKQYSELTTSEKTNIVSWWALDEVFLGSNRIVNPSSANFYENGAIVEDKAGSFTEVLIDNIDTLDNWEVGSNATMSINADGNLLATGSGGQGSITIKSNIVTLDTSSFYVFELEIVGGNDTSANLRIDDEEYGQVKYFNGYYNSTTTSTSTPGQLTGRIKTSSSNTGFYLRLSGIDDTKTTIIKHFKLYKVASGNPGVLL
tara:strand:- start:189 stop:2129 length:1941 start_codon:yes stop_codon:yes gene_type:complete